MPNILIKVPTGAFSDQQRKRLLTCVSEAAIAHEHMGSDPRQRSLCWVLIEEVRAADWLCGGISVHAHAIPCIVLVKVPAGVLDEQMRKDYVLGLHQAIEKSTEPDDGRMLMTSIQLTDVADGTWGANGSLWRLADFTRAAGYGHLLPST
ncbi:tautomerase family protein [Pseudomonas sp. MSSRFD41]|uniref:tautomerase family protein n=1 Tax=unclassified Pseudomonas TaxID=196821 RepID=UPI00163975CA|nr:tautomerase family protein [Pseudomonas sp. MSSRFD41]MBC2656680.1 tautomerase family protein [Pseudomonas sp. MSSRFD41]